MSGTCPVRAWVGVSPPRAGDAVRSRRLQTYRRHINQQCAGAPVRFMRVLIYVLQHHSTVQLCFDVDGMVQIHIV